MTSIPLTSPVVPNLAGLGLRMAPILAHLRQIIAARAGRDRSVVSLVLLLWARLARIGRRFDLMAARLAAGRPAVRVRAVVAAPSRDRAAAVRPRLPRDDGWLMRRIPEARAIGTQLAALLAEPGVAALLAAEPAALRLLRPLGRLLDFALPDPVRAAVGSVASSRDADPAPAGVVGSACVAASAPASAETARAPPGRTG